MNIYQSTKSLEMKQLKIYLPCSQVPGAGWPIIYRQDVKVLL